MVLEPCEVCSTWRVEFTEPSGLANTHIYIELSYTIFNIVAKLEAITLPFSMEDSEYESLPTEKATVHLAAGALAGVMEHCAMYPVDCVKTRMQSLRPHPNAKYRNIHHAFRSMMKKEGLFTPLRGMNVVALGAGPAHALYFSTYEAMKKFVNGNQTGYNPVSHGEGGWNKSSKYSKPCANWPSMIVGASGGASLMTNGNNRQQAILPKLTQLTK
ncbi:Mitoferrin-2B [Acropora cervicornis]|uniref:Mitoferrin-1 n=1 Tax=Acropora cervicornis TaxID=6130 RepID=A0AAD9V221_ACRCE|nr:Mitoferrin-2B [Acropora cervicornis]